MYVHSGVVCDSVRRLFWLVICTGLQPVAYMLLDD